MAPSSAFDVSGDRRNGSSRKAAKKERAMLQSPKQPHSEPPPPDVTDGLEEFDKFFHRLHEQRDELESNLVSGLNAQKSLEQRYAELQVENKKRENELTEARAEVETLKGTLAKRDEEAAARDAELGKSKELIKKHDDEKKELFHRVLELEGQLRQKSEVADQESERARRALEEKDEALRSAEKRVQRILAYAQTKVSEVVDKNQELLKRLHGSL